eukprot:GEMP01005563.1.p1 GENE.GEMP01005563.1~~GEMP01005563.1.p1  ORF type:complete len:264 (+),score=60.63 GEMP01005563.1:87-878(+)
MELILKDVDMLADILESVKDLCETVDLVVDEDAMKISSYDAEKTALIALEWKKEYFLKYQIHEPTTLNISPEFMLKILKLSPPGAQLKITRHTVQEGDGILYLEFTGADGRVCKCDMTLYESDADATAATSLPRDVMQQKNIVHMSTALWSTIMREFKSFTSKILSMHVNPDTGMLKFLLEADLGKGVTAVYNASGSSCEMELAEFVDSDFLMDYIANFRAPRHSKMCHLYMSKDNPLGLVYDLGENAEFGTLKFVVAPQANN